jgi:putative DNA modification/repair radical SAM protein
MNLNEKLKILADSAKYDVSCSSSGSSRANGGGLGTASIGGICHSWSADGRCISLLKILLSNHCIYDCAYCINRRSNDRKRAFFTADEVVKLTIEFYRRNYIEGLFLSSGVLKSPDYTTEQFIEIARRLRTEERFYGYIHMKAIPDSDPALIEELGRYVDRLSVNIELPSEKSLKLLAPEKRKEGIVKPMTNIDTTIQKIKDERRNGIKSTPKFVPAGQTTQMIIGATPDSDFKIITLSENLYKRFNLKRVYYSGYNHVNEDSLLPTIVTPPLLREHRLYQADWLMRFYGFEANEILDPTNPFLDEKFDPKINWALNNFSIFPVEINRAEYGLLLRVPGIGITSAKKIVAARKYNSLTFDHLKKMRVVLKRAKYFITCNGNYMGYSDDKDEVRNNLLYADKHAIGSDYRQLTLF